MPLIIIAEVPRPTVNNFTSGSAPPVLGNARSMARRARTECHHSCYEIALLMLPKSPR
jgi:hypothetical protein